MSVGARRLKYLLLTISFAINASLHSQDTVMLRQLRDSVNAAKDDTSQINALRKLGNGYYRIQPDSAIYFTRKALTLAEKINWTKGIAQNCLNLGNYFIYISKYDSAIYFSTRALKAAKLVGEKNRIALIYINRGAAYTETQQFEKAMPDLSEAMRISEEVGNKDREARAAQGICELYIYQQKNESALPWGEKALQLARELGNEELMGTAEMSLGGLYMDKKNFKKAEQLLLDAIPKSRSAHKTDVVMSAAITLSEIYNETHQYQKALTILKEALAEGLYTKENDQIAALYNSIGNTYSHLAQFNEAAQAYKEGYSAVKGRNEFQQRQYSNLEGLANTYASLGDYKKAYESFSLALPLKDSVSEKTQNKKILELQTQFEVERKEKEITLLKKNQQLHTTELQKERTVKLGAFILSGLLLIIGFLTVNWYRVLQKAKRMKEIERLRNVIARDLHDDIGSTLSSININSRMALNNMGEEKLVKGQLEKINEYSRGMMEGMSDIVWAINPGNDSIEKLLIRMKAFAAEMLEPLEIHLVFEEKVDVTRVRLDVGRRKEIYMIFKEAINNAAKYSSCRNILIVLENTITHLTLKIADDGHGFDQNSAGPGNGLRNMQQRALAIGALFEISTEPGKGTGISLHVPVT